MVLSMRSSPQVISMNLTNGNEDMLVGLFLGERETSDNSRRVFTFFRCRLHHVTTLRGTS